MTDLLFAGAQAGIGIRVLGYLLCLGTGVAAAFFCGRGAMDPFRKATAVCGCLSGALWAVGGLFGWDFRVAEELELVRTASWLLFLAACLGPWTILSRWFSARPPLAVLVVGVFLTFPVIGIVIQISSQSAGVAVGFWQIAANVLSLVLLENILKNGRAGAGSGVVLLLSGIGLVSIYELIFFASVLVFYENSSGIYDFRGVMFAAGAVLVAMGVRRKTKGQGEFALSRHAIFHTTVLVGAGIYLVTTSVFGEVLRLLSGRWGGAVELTFLIAAVISLVVLLRSASVRAKAMVFIGKHFFRLKYDYREVWLAFIRRMAGPEAHENLHERALRAVASAILCDSGALWALQRPIDTYVPVAHWNMSDDLPLVEAEDQLAAFLSTSGWIIDIDQCAADADFYSGLVLPEWLSRQDKVWILVPLIHNRVLEAFLVLGNPRSRPSQLGWEEFDLLKTVGAQAASYLAEDRALRELADTRRLGEFNRRFAFVVHDIKNVVSQMSLMVQNAERFGDDPEFQKDMLDTVSSSVERLHGMLVQLGNKQPSRRIEIQPLEIDHLSAGVADRWSRLYAGAVLNPARTPVVVNGVAEKLVSVLDHLVQNAVDAAGPSGRVEISVFSTVEDGVIEVTDNGLGMTKEFIRDRLFRPLETSKAHGSGLGAFQALKMVREMGGRLEVDSHVGRGTTMRVSLPLCLGGHHNTLNMPEEISYANGSL